MGSRHTFFTFPLLQDLLFVEDQGIAVAIQHFFGPFPGFPINEVACVAALDRPAKCNELNSFSAKGTR